MSKVKWARVQVRENWKSDSKRESFRGAILKNNLDIYISKTQTDCLSITLINNSESNNCCSH